MSNIKNKSGMAPGSLIYEGEEDPKKTSIKCFDISSDGVETTTIDSIDSLPNVKKDRIFWIRVVGLANIALISELGKKYKLSHLTLEDILDTTHRPKFEDNDSYMFAIMKTVRYLKNDDDTSVSQISMVLKNGLLITFEESRTVEISTIVKRTNKHPDNFVLKGSVYLVYAILDSIVDNYLVELTAMESDIEDIEDQMIERVTPIGTDELFMIKRRLNTLHRMTRPLIEIVDKVTRVAHITFSDYPVADFFKDLSDHAIRLNDTIQNIKDTINAINDENTSRLLLASNSVFSTLTIFSVIFLPPMVISGIYGMNFSNIPMLENFYGFPISILLMIMSSGILLLLFKKKKYF